MTYSQKILLLLEGWHTPPISPEQPIQRNPFSWIPQRNRIGIPPQPDEENSLIFNGQEMPYKSITGLLPRKRIISAHPSYGHNVSLGGENDKRLQS